MYSREKFNVRQKHSLCEVNNPINSSFHYIDLKNFNDLGAQLKVKIPEKMKQPIWMQRAHKAYPYELKMHKSS